MRLLYVAYPLLPVSGESCGGAEQILWTLEAQMARRGHLTWTAACEGSRLAGRLLPTGAATSEPDWFEQRDAEHTAAILKFLSSALGRLPRFDVVHDMSGSFWRHAAEIEGPVLATLHLPRTFYPAEAFRDLPPNLFFNCVSDSQLRSFAGLPRMLGVVRNGIPLDYFPPPRPFRDDYLLWLGRICEEKGTHLAIEATRRAGATLVIAGDVYPFSYHQAYFEREVRPHLQRRSSKVCYAGVPTFSEKLKLLRRARALLLPSLVEETSSLVAMEAMACGTPVVGFRRGAIPEVVRHGVTGIVVDTVEAMAAAVRRVQAIDPAACRAHVEKNFSSARMASEYEQLYAAVARQYTESRRTVSAA
jgi:glycosyltransferase involved in cell wall biosynthesis